MKKIWVILAMACTTEAKAQVLGGEYTFEFLRLAQSPHIAALGGYAVSNPAPDLMLSTGNPALLRPEFHTQLGLNYNRFYAGTQTSNMLFAYHHPKLNTTFGFGIQYLNYGSFLLTDNIGNVLGNGNAADYSIQLSASRQYLERWRYGATIKLAHSKLISNSSLALVADIGVMYADTNRKLYIGAVVKNAGLQLKKYQAADGSQPLPLDLQVGITKRFKKAPFSISVLGHHLYTWDVHYNNPADKKDNILLFNDSSTTAKEKNYFAEKLFRHLAFALDINLGKRLEISVGYNHLRRGELGIDERKGMAGFSYGVGMYLNKFVIHYARSHYHLAGAYNEFGINFSLNQLFGVGPGGRKINWTEKYARAY